MVHWAKIFETLALVLTGIFLLLTRVAIYYKARITQSAAGNWGWQMFYYLFIYNSFGFPSFSKIKAEEYPDDVRGQILFYNKFVKVMYGVLAIAFLFGIVGVVLS